ATKRRNDETSGTRAGPRHSRAIDGSGLALLRGYPGHHRQAQRDRLEHRAAPAGEPAAALGLQSHASLAGKLVERFWPPGPPVRVPARVGALTRSGPCLICALGWYRMSIHRNSHMTNGRVDERRYAPGQAERFKEFA